MKKSSRIIVFVLSLSLVAAYFLPFWEIDLDAPQYPEGLGMKICINKMTGDIPIINGLNHYIGMKIIEPDTIPELKYMPYFLGFLISFGLLVAFTGKKTLLVIWVVLFLVIGTIGSIDFYMWEYDYGHNLNPHAAIKVPGMNYQPPLWGTKQLLNFTAYSYPDSGGWLIILVGVGTMLLLVYEQLFNKKYQKKYISTYHSIAALISVPLFFLISGCSREAEPIKYGIDICQNCKMTVLDNRFGGEVITEKGKIYKFDCVECLFSFYTKNKNSKDSLLTIDFSQPATWIDARRCVYFICPKLPSPMGKNITAFSSEAHMKKVKESYMGISLRWEELPTALGKIN